MDNIIEPDNNFSFDNLFLGIPTNITGGAFFTKIFFKNKPLYIQTPKCLTKQGFIKNGKKIYCDLMIDNNDSIFINWLEKLENTCHNLIYDKKENWFDNKIEMCDIENSFTPIMKIYKSGKYYLVRVNIKNNIKIYNENDDILNLENINTESIISIIEIQGIKFTSKSFNIELEMKQCMLVCPDPFVETCFIKKPIKYSKQNEIIKNEVKENVNEDINEEVKENVNEEVNEEVKEEVKKCINKDNENKEISSQINSILNDENKLNELNNILENFENKIKEEKNENKLKIKFDNSIINDDDYDDDNILIIHDNNNKNENIVIQFEDLNSNNINIDEELKEFKLENNDIINDDIVKLKKENEIYYNMYKEIKENAKKIKKEYDELCLKAKHIKELYNIEENESDEWEK